MRYLPKRKSLRLKNFDYTTSNAYFITICSYERLMIFEHPALIDIMHSTWQELPTRFPTLRLDEFIVMPNHIHGIIWLDPQHNTETALNLSYVVQVFKSLVATRWIQWMQINDYSGSPKIWQRSYYDRIIRNDSELNAIREYIKRNPERWAEDRENLDNLLLKMNTSNSD